MKRIFDLLISGVGLLVLGPLLLVVMFLVWKQDRHSPFYIASRVGKGGKEFPMLKLRSMVVNADQSGVDSTSTQDARITPVGHFIRSYKLDELSQLWNVVKGDMSLVGPRPNVKRETDLYTAEEKQLLQVPPGITDFSSIVFSDEGEILAGKEDPDLAYNQLIRPWKSRLGLAYIKHRSMLLDMQLIVYTVVAVVSRKRALQWVVSKLSTLGISDDVVEVCKREQELVPSPPPGMDDIVVSRAG